MDDESSSSFWLSKILKSKKRESVIEQKITGDAYRDLRALLMRAKPDVIGDRVILKLPNGTVELSRDRLKVVANSKEHAEKILRNLHPLFNAARFMARLWVELLDKERLSFEDKKLIFLFPKIF